MKMSALTSATIKGNNSGTSSLEKGAAAAHEAIDKATVAVASKIAAGAHRGVNAVADAAAPAAGWLGQAADKARRQRQELLDGYSEQVRAKPLAYIGMALAIGFLVGRIMR